MPKPEELPKGLEGEAKALSEWACVPVFGKGFSLPGGSLLVETRQRDLERNAQRSAWGFASLTGGAPSFGFEVRGAHLVVPSPSGRRVLIVRNGEDRSKPPVLELWGGGRCLREVEVPPAMHGPVCCEGWFECVSWSADESRVVYAAEAPSATQTPLWGGRSPPNAPKEGDGWRGVGEHAEDWGEQLTGLRREALFVLSFPSGEIHTVTGLPPDCSCGQAVWTPDGASLVFAAWPHAGENFGAKRRLGLVFCFNRPSHLWRVAAPGTGNDAPVAECLTPEVPGCCLPRFNPAGNTLAMLCNEAACTSGAHNDSVSLRVLPWDSQGVAGPLRTVVDTVESPLPGGFPGLYCASLARNPWVSDTRLIMATTWGSADAIVSIDLGTGDVTQLTPPVAVSGHWALLDVAHGVALAVNSTPASPPVLHAASVSDWKWAPLEAAPEPFGPAVEAALSALTWRLLSVPGQPDVEAILLRPAPVGDTPPVCVLVPHGGPHSACAATFIPSLAYLASQGFAVLQVNYRGSLGFGRGPMLSLIGRAGVQDVADCVACLDAACAQGLVHPKLAAVLGGSHGGFLAGHLIGQHPSRFFAAAMRNPVTDISAMVGLTDIPDWCFVESALLGKGAYDEAPSAEALAAMRAVSPVAHLAAVRTPVLMLVGAKDRRVPPSNGLAYARQLRQKGVPVRVILFPEDEHGLTRPRTELESYLNITAWLREHQPSG